jgi:flagellar M-ring protein FliF
MVGDQASSAAAGVAGARGNLPGAPAPSTGTTPAGVTRLQETRNYEVNRVVSKTTGPRVKIGRLHVAVLVDQGGATPRSAEELERISALAREAAGLSRERGDSLEVHSAPFAAVPAEPAPAAPPAPAPPAWPLPVSPLVAAAAGGGLLLLLVLIGAVVALRRRRRLAELARPSALPSLPARVAEVEALVTKGELPAGDMSGLPGRVEARDRALTAARADAARAARLLSAWLTEKTA